MSPRKLWIALGISLVVNVLFVGFLAGRFLHRRSVADAFDARPIRGVWKRNDALIRPRGLAVEAARRKIVEALRAEPFQPEALETALSDLRVETEGAQRVLHRALVDSSRDLTPEERRQLAGSGWLAGGGHRRGGR